MSVLEPPLSKPTLFERFTLRGLLVTFAIGAVASFLLEIFWMFLGIAFFTAKESDMPWYALTGMLIIMLLMVSVGGLLVTLVATLIRRFQSR